MGSGEAISFSAGNRKASSSILGWFACTGWQRVRGGRGPLLSSEFLRFFKPEVQSSLSNASEGTVLGCSMCLNFLPQEPLGPDPNPGVLF